MVLGDSIVLASLILPGILRLYLGTQQIYSDPVTSVDAFGARRPVCGSETVRSSLTVRYTGSVTSVRIPASSPHPTTYIELRRLYGSGPDRSHPALPHTLHRCGGNRPLNVYIHSMHRPLPSTSGYEILRKMS